MDTPYKTLNMLQNVKNLIPVILDEKLFSSAMIKLPLSGTFFWQVHCSYLVWYSATSTIHIIGTFY